MELIYRIGSTHYVRANSLLLRGALPKPWHVRSETKHESSLACKSVPRATLVECGTLEDAWRATTWTPEAA